MSRPGPPTGVAAIQLPGDHYARWVLALMTLAVRRGIVEVRGDEDDAGIEEEAMTQLGYLPALGQVAPADTVRRSACSRVGVRL